MMKKALFLVLILSYSCKNTPNLPDAHEAGWNGQPVVKLSTKMPQCVC